MKFKRTLIYFPIIILNFCIAQNKIEVLLNGVVTNSNQTISVSTADDKIEIRIYPNSKQKINSLIDSIQTEGCGDRIIQKKHFVFLEPKVNDIRQQLAKNSVNKKYYGTTFKKPVFKSTYYSFELKVYEVSGCKGKFFYLSLIFDKDKSNLNTFGGYQTKYKFILL